MYFIICSAQIETQEERCGTKDIELESDLLMGKVDVAHLL